MGALRYIFPPLCGFTVGWATRSHLFEAARTSLKKEATEKPTGTPQQSTNSKAPLQAEVPHVNDIAADATQTKAVHPVTATQAKKCGRDDGGRKDSIREDENWCDCTSLAVVHRMFVTQKSTGELSATLKRLATSRINTQGFKSISVFTRPILGPAGGPKSALEKSDVHNAHRLQGETAATTEDPSKGPQGSQGFFGMGEASEFVAGEVLVIEEWLNPFAAVRVLGSPEERRKGSPSLEMRGTLWVCVAPGPL
ncbi:hypothetical protein cyc_04449 [Cyclospora cayetanensis]|nr:hypothetical protein cyc_04449 [Cyclospora cayetanensis]